MIPRAINQLRRRTCLIKLIIISGITLTFYALAFFLTNIHFILPVHAQEQRVPVLEQDGEKNAACVLYDNSTRTIRICGLDALSLTEVNSVINDPTILSLGPSKVWFLNSNIKVENRATLFLNSSDISWLKINSTAGIAYSIISEGNLLIDNIKITSWNSTANLETRLDTIETPRAYLWVPQNASGQMNITNSDLSYLGNAKFDSDGTESGHTTGVSYSSGDGSIIKNSTLSYNYRGSYATHVSNMIFANNTVANSYQYGYHPRSGAANLQIYGNVIYKSGSHGIICSVLCRDLLIEDNLLYNNSGNGIMLDQLVGNSTVSGNIIYDNDHGGIVIWNSSDNTVVNNLVDDNAYGIIVASSSSNNDIRENIIRTSEENGIFLYDNSTSNLFEENKILQSVGSGIYIRDQSTRDNRFILNTIMKSLESGFLVSNTSQNVMVDNHVFENIKYQYYIKSNSTNNVVKDSIFKNTDIRFFDNSSNLILANNNNLISATNKEMPSGVYTDNSTLVVFPVNKNIVVHTLEMSAIPSSNYVEILPLENSNNYTINTSWIENAPDDSISTKYSLGGFPPKKEFIIWVNNIAWSPVTSNSTGYITFIYDGGGFERIFRIEPGLPIDPLNTKIPKIPTIAILTLAGIGVLIAVRIFKRRNRAIEST
jgi:parallel beta-helix repeat protein